MVADIISTVEFNHDGEYLATGDKGGRVVIFQRGGLPVVCISELVHKTFCFMCVLSHRNHLWVSHLCSVVIITSTALFSHTSRNLITLRAWRLKKK